MRFLLHGKCCCTYYLTQSLGSWWYLPLKVTSAGGGTFDNLLISLKMILNLGFPAWMDKPLCDDYSEIRPENRDKVQRCILAKETQRWTFLHLTRDDYLIPSKQYIIPWLVSWTCQMGKSLRRLLPDTFGNMGQAPQILQKSGIHVAAFGRGVKPVALTTKSSKMSSLLPVSEMYWQGAGRKS